MTYDLNCIIPGLAEGKHKFVLEAVDNIGTKTYYTKEFTVANLDCSNITFTQTAEKQIKASVTINNIGTVDANTILVIALYTSTGGMCAATVDNGTIIAGKELVLEANIDLPATPAECREAGYTVRAFVCDGLDNMKIHVFNDYVNFGL